MALPGNSLSTSAVWAQFVGARAMPVTSAVDYEDGGVGIQDPSQGLLAKVWRARLLGRDVVLDAPDVAPVTIYSAAGITEISFTFDQNMRPVLAFVQSGVARLRWFDPLVGQVVVTDFPGIITPRVTLDDKRDGQGGNSDVLLAYIRGEGALCYRQQRDRFQVERVLGSGPHKGLIKIGMTRNSRVAFQLEAV